MKVKITCKECLEHSGDSDCCNYDLEDLILDARDCGGNMYPIEVYLPDGSDCVFNYDEIKIVEE